MQKAYNDRTNEIFRFSILVFLWSWLWWIPRILATFNVMSLSPLWDAVLGTIGALGPGLAAWAQIWHSKGKTEAFKFFGRGWKLNFNPILFLPAILIMPIIGGITTGVLALTGLENPMEFEILKIMELPLGIIITLLIISAIGEEFGWRGFLQHQLQNIVNPFKASLILGLIWGVWQLPLHFVSGTLQSVIPILEIILQSIALAILFTWLYNKTGGSIFIVILFHFSVVLCGLIFPVWAGFIARWVYLLLIIASIVLMGFLVGLRNYKKS